MKTYFKILAVSLLSILMKVQGQKVKELAFNQEEWDIEAKEHRFETYKGQNSLYLENGRARLKNSSFKNGVIEYDIAFEEERNFAGIIFRIHDNQNYEEYYLRPHQSGNPDSMQYTPVINGNSSWQLYHGEGYWSAFQYRFGEWMHIKLLIHESKMQVFIDDTDKPVLNVTDLKLNVKSGGIGFRTFLGAAHYANLTYQKLDSVSFVGDHKEDNHITQPRGLITSYEVSKAFPSNTLEGITQLKDLQIPTVKKMETEPTGLLNLSIVSPVNKDSNTVLAKFIVESISNDTIVPLEFGYSDKVRVFVNGGLVYSGNNGFRSRDYRYLGSIGFFDSIFLDLQKGPNEVVFVVTERMGGWGVQAKLAR